MGEFWEDRPPAVINRPSSLLTEREDVARPTWSARPRDGCATAQVRAWTTSTTRLRWRIWVAAGLSEVTEYVFGCSVDMTAAVGVDKREVEQDWRRGRPVVVSIFLQQVADNRVG